MLLYLTRGTWTRGEASSRLGDQVLMAMEMGIHVLLAHEMPCMTGKEDQLGCNFSDFFEHPEGATPTELLNLGVYAGIALPLKSGAWRETSMALLWNALCMDTHEMFEVNSGGDVLGISRRAATRVNSALAATEKMISHELALLPRVLSQSKRRTRSSLKSTAKESAASPSARHVDVSISARIANQNLFRKQRRRALGVETRLEHQRGSSV